MSMIQKAHKTPANQRVRASRAPVSSASKGEGSAHKKPKPGTAHAPEVKARALQLAAAVGTRAASEQTGVPIKTIQTWKSRAHKRELVPYGRLHGANSERDITERSKIINQQLLSAAPWLARNEFLPSVSLYLRSAARSSLLDEYIERAAAEKGIEHVPSRTLEQATSASNLAFKQAEALGITPAGFNKLKLLAAGAAGAEDAVAKLQAQGREVREARAAKDSQ